MNYEVISSTSKGNCVIYKEIIMVDLGVSFAEIESRLPQIKIIFLTHKHGDHFNTSTIIRVGKLFPNILLVIPEILKKEFDELNYEGRFIIIKRNQKMKFLDVIFESFPLFHDVDNVGWKINKSGFKIVHATDTASIDHIEAKGYDIYAIEHNYDEDILNETIKQKALDGTFSYEIRMRDTHLSFQKASRWILSQCKPESEIILLHISSSYTE